MGTAIGAVAGGATGASIGLPIGAAIATSVIPGIGPIIAAGILGAALFGAGGAADRPQDRGHPHARAAARRAVLLRGSAAARPHRADRAGRDRRGADRGRGTALEAAGAESVDAAREAWWVGLRDEEARAYAARGGDFARTSRSIVAASRPRCCRSCAAAATTIALVDLGRLYPDVCQADAFRCGFERGQMYDDARRTAHGAAARRSRGVHLGGARSPLRLQSARTGTDGNQRSSGESSQRIVSSRCGPVEIMQNGTPVSSSSRSR